MTSSGQFLFLGTGGSMGVPLVGCHCDVCSSPDPCNKRLRCSALVTVGGKRFLIDAGPDVRQQALRYGIDGIDGLLLTHAHYDHTAGLDELRVYNIRNKTPLPCLMNRDTLADVTERFAYIFRPVTQPKTLVVKYDITLLPEERGELVFQGVTLRYCTFRQLGMSVNGYRFGSLAYICDIRDYPDTIFEDLRGVDQLVISALRHQPSPMHLTVEEAVAFSKRVGAQHTWLTHIAHELDHEKTNALLPANVRMAYDGLSLEFMPFYG